MKRETVDLFEKLSGQLSSLHAELTMLAKKSPKDAVNEFKLKFINAVLEQCNSLFGDENRPFDDFDRFSVESLPSNSDVTFILSQYIECAEKFRADNIKPYGGVWWWKIDREERPTIRTAAPRKIIRK
jgi:hypothetical protein